MDEKIKVYQVSLEDWHDGAFATSLVERPAIGVDAKHFSENIDKPFMNFSSEEKREVVGAVLIPDILIPRKAADGSLFYVQFSKEVIEGINQRMKQANTDKYFTFAHKYDAGRNVVLLESWIKEFEEDKSNAYGFDLPIGTLFMKVKVEDETLWNLVKENKLNGFSIELDADFVLNEKETENFMKKELFANHFEVNDRVIVWDGAAEIGESTKLFEIVSADEKEEVKAFEGQFEQGNKIFEVKEGVLTVTEKEEQKAFNANELMEAIGKMVDEKLASHFEKVSEGIEEVKLLQSQSNSGDDGKEGESITETTKNFSRSEALLNSRDWFSGRAAAKKLMD